MTNGQWLYVFGMEAAINEKKPEVSSDKPRGKTYQIRKES